MELQLSKRQHQALASSLFLARAKQKKELSSQVHDATSYGVSKNRTRDLSQSSLMLREHYTTKP